MALALERIYRALAPGGWLIIGLYVQPSDKLGQALTNLRIVRSGGYPWTIRELEDRLDALGFDQIEALSASPQITFVLGQRPDGPR